MAQSTATNPADTSSVAGASVETLLKADAGNIFSAFERSAEGINTSDFETSRVYLAYMRSNYSDYKQNLARLKNPGSQYFVIDSSLSNLINATADCISESEDNYYYYKILRIYIVRKDSKNSSGSVNHFVTTVNDFFKRTDDIQANASLIKKHTGNLGINASSLDSGLGHIDYYGQIVVMFIQNQKVGLTKDYSVYDGYELTGYQEVYDYLVNSGQPVPLSLGDYIAPEKSIPTTITIQANNLSAHYLETIELSGKVTYNNGSALPRGRVSVSFNDRAYFTTTNENGTYGLRIPIDGPINSYSYDLSASYGGNITRDVLLMSSSSTTLKFTLLMQNVSLTTSCPDTNFAVEDNLTIVGNLAAENGIPVANDIISAYLEEANSTGNTSIVYSIGNGTSDRNGYYFISYKIPDYLRKGNLTIHTVYKYPAANVTNTINSNRIIVSLLPVKPSFKFAGMPLVYFNDDLLGIKGRLILPNGQNISGQDVIASLSGASFDQDSTDEDGIFLLSDVVGSDDLPGIKSLTLTTPGNGNTVLPSSETVGNVVVLPYDKTTFILSLSVALLCMATVCIVALIVINGFRRRANPDDSGAAEER